MHQGCDLPLDRPAATGGAEMLVHGVRLMEPDLSSSATCQHASLATPCAAGRRLDRSVATSWDDVVRSMVLESSVWGPYSLHGRGHRFETCHALIFTARRRAGQLSHNLRFRTVHL
jgi:hypothetical protein